MLRSEAPTVGMGRRRGKGLPGQAQDNCGGRALDRSGGRSDHHLPGHGGAGSAAETRIPVQAVRLAAEHSPQPATIQRQSGVWAPGAQQAVLSAQRAVY